MKNYLPFKPKFNHPKVVPTIKIKHQYDQNNNLIYASPDSKNRRKLYLPTSNQIFRSERSPRIKKIERCNQQSKNQEYTEAQDAYLSPVSSEKSISFKFRKLKIQKGLIFKNQEAKTQLAIVNAAIGHDSKRKNSIYLRSRSSSQSSHKIIQLPNKKEINFQSNRRDIDEAYQNKHFEAKRYQNQLIDVQKENTQIKNLKENLLEKLYDLKTTFEKERENFDRQKQMYQRKILILKKKVAANKIDLGHIFSYDNFDRQKLIKQKPIVEIEFEGGSSICEENAGFTFNRKGCSNSNKQNALRNQSNLEKDNFSYELAKDNLKHQHSISNQTTDENQFLTQEYTEMIISKRISPEAIL